MKEISKDMERLVKLADERDLEAKAKHIDQQQSEDLQFYKEQTEHLSSLSKQLQKDL